jgi:DNA-binding NarL/FixJ family response regulator
MLSSTPGDSSGHGREHLGMGPPGASESHVPLSGREVEVLDLVVAGLKNAAVARRLGISERTVREHVARIFLKLHVSSRVEAAVVATKRRLAREYAGNGAVELDGVLT